MIGTYIADVNPYRTQHVRSYQIPFASQASFISRILDCSDDIMGFLFVFSSDMSGGFLFWNITLLK
jgi:hypothetical protein